MVCTPHCGLETGTGLMNPKVRSSEKKRRKKRKRQETAALKAEVAGKPPPVCRKSFPRGRTLLPVLPAPPPSLPVNVSIARESPLLPVIARDWTDRLTCALAAFIKDPGWGSVPRDHRPATHMGR